MLDLVAGGDQDDVADAVVGSIANLRFGRADERCRDLALGFVDLPLVGIEDALEADDMLLGFVEVIAEGFGEFGTGGLLDHGGKSLVDDLLFAVERVLQHVDVQLAKIVYIRCKDSHGPILLVIFADTPSRTRGGERAMLDVRFRTVRVPCPAERSHRCRRVPLCCTPVAVMRVVAARYFAWCGRGRAALIILRRAVSRAGTGRCGRRAGRWCRRPRSLRGPGDARRRPWRRGRRRGR